MVAALEEQPLTWRQNLAFCYIRDYIEEHGYAPTIREIGDAAHLASLSSTHYVLTRLEAKGYIKRIHGRHAMVIEPGHAGKVLVSRDDLLAVLLGIGATAKEIEAARRRLEAAAGAW